MSSGHLDSALRDGQASGPGSGIMRLIGDVGGTNARFALATGGGIAHERNLVCADYPDIAQAIESYLHDAGFAAPANRPREAALAIASPISGDLVRMTNNPWQFSALVLRQQLRLERLLILNDFTALAMSLTALPLKDLEQVGGHSPPVGQPLALLGPGTGLGVSGLIPAGDSHVPLQGEGGHVTLGATTAREQQVLDALKRRFEHVSAERVLSGPGLVNLHDALSDLSGRPSGQLAPSEITRRALAAEDPVSEEALSLFCAFLGTVAGNLALTLGATGGVYIGGGIVPRLGAYFANSLFRERFAAKGRYASYLTPIPVYVIHTPQPAFIGLVRSFSMPGPRVVA
jgi:glucokinase